MSNDQRPAIWIGHVSIRTQTLDATEAFLKQVGLRSIVHGDQVAVLELRGGTHIVVRQDAAAEPKDADFDFMVEDLQAAHAEFKSKGLTVTEIESGRIHDSFVVTEPGGNRIPVNSSHVPDHDKV